MYDELWLQAIETEGEGWKIKGHDLKSMCIKAKRKVMTHLFIAEPASSISMVGSNGRIIKLGKT